MDEEKLIARYLLAVLAGLLLLGTVGFSYSFWMDSRMLARKDRMVEMGMNPDQPMIVVNSAQLKEVLEK